MCPLKVHVPFEGWRIASFCFSLFPQTTPTHRPSTHRPIHPITSAPPIFPWKLDIECWTLNIASFLLPKMKPLLILFLSLASATAQLAVEHVRGAQRAGTKLVDIYFDVTGTAESVTVDLEVSYDGGATWSVSAASLSGHAGAGVAPGRNRHIVWNAGADWDGQYSARMRYRVRRRKPARRRRASCSSPAGGSGWATASERVGPTNSPCTTCM